MRIRSWSVVAVVLLAVTGTALAENPWVGTWKLDPAQSKLTGDTIHFASGAGGEMMLTEEGHTTKFKMDGATYKTWSGADVTWKKADDHTFESHYMRNDVDLGTDTWTISPDGKMLKSEGKGTHPDGSSFDDVTEYTRVKGSDGLAGSWKSMKMDMNDEQTYVIAEKGPSELNWDIPAIKGTVDIKLDGKDYAPVGPTVPKGLTLALLNPSPDTLKLTEKMNGQETMHSTMTLSADGKMITEVGSPAKTNEPFTEVWVKQ